MESSRNKVVPPIVGFHAQVQNAQVQSEQAAASSNSLSSTIVSSANSILGRGTQLRTAAAAAATLIKAQSSTKNATAGATSTASSTSSSFRSSHKHSTEKLKKTSGILLIYNDVGDNDTFRIVIDQDAEVTDRLTAGVWKLRSLNETLFDNWVPIDKAEPWSLPESILVDFHLFLALHKQQLDGKINSCIDISLLQASNLRASLNKEPIAVSPPTPQPHKWKEMKFQDAAAHVHMRFRYCDSIDEVREGAPLRIVFANSLLWFREFGSLDKIQLAMTEFLTTFTAADGRVPDVFPDMEWDRFIENKPIVYEKLEKDMLTTAWEEFPKEQREEIMKTIAEKQVESKRWKESAMEMAHGKEDEEPSTKAQAIWNKAKENAKAQSKNVTSSITSSKSPADEEVVSEAELKSRMQLEYNRAPSAIKVLIHNFSKALITKLGNLLTKDNKQYDGDDASMAAEKTVDTIVEKCHLKGAFSDCGKHSVSVTIESIDSHELMDAYIFKWVGEGQTTFGLQPYVEGFKDREYRFWFTSGASSLVDVTKRWRFACLLQSCNIDLHGVTKFQVEQSSTLVPEANACYDLALKLVTEHKFFADLLTLKHSIPAIRLDCGYNPTTNTAFLNELAVSPGGWLFSQVHKLDILSYVTDELSNQMAECLQPPSSQ